MPKGYTTTTKVSEFLQTDITSGTTPSIDTVNEWIEWAEDEIDRTAGYSFTTESVSDVYLEGQGYREFWLPQEYLPLSSITTMEINTGSDFDETWVEKTEGTDFLIIDQTTGHIKFNTNTTGFALKDRQLKIDLVHGFDTIPFIVENLATKMAAKSYINSVLSETATGGNESIRVGPITIKDGSKDTLSMIRSTNEDINKLMETLGKWRVYMY